MAVIKIKKEFFSAAVILFCLYFMFRFPLAVKSGVTEGMKICFTTVIPSLFPFMVLSSYTVKSGRIRFSGKMFSSVTNVLFRQPSCTIPVILISMVGGFPVGLKGTSDLFSEGIITQNQACRLGLFCINAGPAFVISGVGGLMLGNLKAGIIIYVSLCISSLILGIISSFFSDKRETPLSTVNSKISRNYSLSDAIEDAVQSILNICAWVILFSSISSCIEILDLNNSLYTVVISFLEVTKGCSLLTTKQSIPVIAGIIGFGGICVHCQIMNHLKSIGLKYSHFLISRIICGFLSAAICRCLLILFPTATEVFSQIGENTPFAFSVSLPSFFVFLTMCIIMIFDIDGKKKI